MPDSFGSFKLFLIDKREIGKNLIPVGLQLPLPDPVTSVQQEKSTELELGALSWFRGFCAVHEPS